MVVLILNTSLSCAMLHLLETSKKYFLKFHISLTHIQWLYTLSLPLSSLFSYLSN